MKAFESFLAPLLKQYLVYRENRGYSTKPTASYLKMFDRYIKDKKIETGVFEPSFFLQLRTEMKVEAITTNRLISTLRGFFNFLVRKGAYEKNPLEDIALLAQNEIIPFLFTPDQIDRLLEHVCEKIRKTERFYLKDFSHYIALVLIARCGLRISESLQLQRCQYRQDEKTLYIEKTKFKKDRLIPVPLAAAKELENFLSVRDALLKEEPVRHLLVGCFRNKLPQYSINITFKKAVKAIGLSQPRRVIGKTNFLAPTVHSLRHSFAVNTLKRIKQQGKSPENALPVLAAYLGHRIYKHTVKYLKMIDADQRQGLLDYVSRQKR